MNNFAILPNQSKGREYPEEPSNYRSDFQRDRDRILHCGSFRKLQFKTQVFLENKGDYSKFDYKVKQLQDIGLADLKIIEDLSVDLENGDTVVETEDTMTLLDNYIDGIDLKVNKSNVKNVMRSLYMEAAEI